MQRIKEDNPNTPEYWKNHWGSRNNLNINYGVEPNALPEAISMAVEGDVLDVGAGSGLLTKYLPGKVTVCDMSQDAVDYLKEKLGHDGFQCDVREGIPVSDKSFDTVVCTEVIEHMDEPKKLVDELKRIARKKVIVTTPNNECGLQSIEHVWLLTEDDLRDLFRPDEAEVTSPDNYHLLGICTL